ncbi:MAG: OB-fold nucleic acid binding domain-containing protein, partial [Rubrobacter sp.]|nr:OB-fold nucleic acid binding domain-containing protein [Rubrobacter sp.]
MAWPTSSGGAGTGASSGEARASVPRITLPERTTLSALRARPATEVPGVGPKVAKSLAELGVESLADLIQHYPSRHEDLSNVKKIADLRVGEKATVVGRVTGTRPVGKPVRGRSPGFSAQLYDGTGYIPATVWGRHWLLGQLAEDTWVVVSGEVQRKYGIQLAAKSVEVVDDPESTTDNAHAGRFVPVYPSNAGINARRVRTLIHRALDECGHVLDPLPAGVLADHELAGLYDAMCEVHFPEERGRLRTAMRRLIFHELFVLQTGLAVQKARVEAEETGRSHAGDGSLLNPYLRGLPFGLT